MYIAHAGNSYVLQGKNLVGKKGAKDAPKCIGMRVGFIFLSFQTA